MTPGEAMLAARITGMRSDGATAVTRGAVSTTSPLTVTLTGASAPVACARVETYSPAQGDQVLVVVLGRALRVVIGRIV